MNGEHKSAIDSRIAELRTVQTTDHDMLLRVVATQEHHIEQVDELRRGLPCQSNKPDVNPQQRLARLEERSTRKESAVTAGGVSVFLIAAVEAVKKTFGL